MERPDLVYRGRTTLMHIPLRYPLATEIQIAGTLDTLCGVLGLFFSSKIHSDQFPSYLTWATAYLVASLSSMQSLNKLPVVPAPVLDSQLDGRSTPVSIC